MFRTCWSAQWIHHDDGRLPSLQRHFNTSVGVSAAPSWIGTEIQVRHGDGCSLRHEPAIVMNSLVPVALVWMPVLAKSLSVLNRLEVVSITVFRMGPA